MAPIAAHPNAGRSHSGGDGVALGIVSLSPPTSRDLCPRHYLFGGNSALQDITTTACNVSRPVFPEKRACFSQL